MLVDLVVAFLGDILLPGGSFYVCWLIRCVVFRMLVDMMGRSLDVDCLGVSFSGCRLIRWVVFRRYIYCAVGGFWTFCGSVGLFLKCCLSLS